MIEFIDVLRWLHVIGAAVLLGTGAGIAFFMLMVHRTRDPRLITHVASTVVIADTLFTATAVITQPITGLLLAHHNSWPLTEGWIVVSIALYVLTGLFWLPVVWIQIRMRDVARRAVLDRLPLPESYERLFRIWFACGIPAFLSVLIIFWLMLMKPSFQIFSPF